MAENRQLIAVVARDERRRKRTVYLIRCSVGVGAKSVVAPFVCTAGRDFQVAPGGYLCCQFTRRQHHGMGLIRYLPVQARRESRSVTSFSRVSGPILAGAVFRSTGGRRFRRAAPPPMISTLVR